MPLYIPFRRQVQAIFAGVAVQPVIKIIKELQDVEGAQVAAVGRAKVLRASRDRGYRRPVNVVLTSIMF